MSMPRIREATPEDARGITRVGIESWRSTYRGHFPDAILDGQDIDAMTPMREQMLRALVPGQFFLVAEAGGEIVGFCTGGDSRDRPDTGEVYAIYLLAEHQGKGIGRALMNESARRLRARGLRGMIVWVLRENAPARGFYERLGGVAELEKKDTVYGGSPDAPRHPVDETGYVWRDLSALGA